MYFNNLINRNFIVLAILSTVALFSCKKDNSKPGTQLPAAKIKSVISEDESMKFEYNTDGTVREAVLQTDLATNGDLVKYTVSYNTLKQISLVVADNGEEIIPVYENGLLVKAFLKTTEGTDLGFTEYEYQEGMLKTAEFYTTIDNELYPFAMLNFQYGVNGNSSRTSLYIQNPLAPNSLLLSGRIYYEYDTKANPLKPVKELLRLLWVAVPENNVIKETHKDKDGNTEETAEYIYSYNNNGTPSSAVMKNTPATGAVVSKNFSFIYK